MPNKEREIKAIKQIDLPTTGIYQRKVKQLTLRADDPESLKTFLDSLEESPSPLWKNLDGALPIGRLEAEARDFLNHYVENDMGGFTDKIRSETSSAGIDFVVSGYIDRTRQDLALEFKKLHSEEEKRELIIQLTRLERASDACEMLFHVSVIRSQLKEGSAPAQHGSVEVMVSNSFALGRAYERFRVRSSERRAWTGAKILKAVSDGGIAAKAGVDQRYQRIAAEFKASGLSQRNFAETRGLPRSNLQRALKRVDPSLSK